MTTLGAHGRCATRVTASASRGSSVSQVPSGADKSDRPFIWMYNQICRGSAPETAHRSRRRRLASRRAHDEIKNEKRAFVGCSFRAGAPTWWRKQAQPWANERWKQQTAPIQYRAFATSRFDIKQIKKIKKKICSMSLKSRIAVRRLSHCSPIKPAVYLSKERCTCWQVARTLLLRIFRSAFIQTGYSLSYETIAIQKFLSFKVKLIKSIINRSGFS